MNNKKITFSRNWNNKLDCKCFSTIRLKNNLEVGDKVEVYYNNSFFNTTIITKEKILLEEIEDKTAYLDTGYSADTTKNILKNIYSKKNIDWTKQSLYIYILKKNRER